MNRKYGNTTMRRKPSRAARSSAASTRGCATPLNAVSAQPNPMPSHSMRASLAMLELASGSLVPRPTTSSSVSSRPSGAAAPIRSAAAASSFGSIARSRPSRTVTPGLAAMKQFISHGRSFLTWLAANSIAGTAQDLPGAAVAQRGQRLADRRPGEFEIAGGEVAVRQAAPARPPPPARIPRPPRDRGCHARTAAPRFRSSSVLLPVDRRRAAAETPAG